jgi:hypothetical protein
LTLTPGHPAEEQRKILRTAALTYRRAKRAGKGQSEAVDAAIAEYRRLSPWSTGERRSTTHGGTGTGRMREAQRRSVEPDPATSPLPKVRLPALRKKARILGRLCQKRLDNRLRRRSKFRFVPRRA